MPPTGTITSMDEAYELVGGCPDLASYRALRELAGLTSKSEAQAVKAIGGEWVAVHAVDRRSGQTVGMGRVIADGGWYFHIVDMAVLPEHQRRGIGGAILTWLTDRIYAAAPDEPYITLLADEAGRPLYRKHGFVETAPGTVGMMLPPDRRPSSC